MAVHDLSADQDDLLRGMGQTNWGGWPSPILPIGEWSFPVAFAEGGYTSQIPVISASHVGKGRMLGYGHESWVYGSGGVEETAFSLGAVEWVCGNNADVGLAYGAGFEGFQDELNQRATRSTYPCPRTIFLALTAFWMSSGTATTTRTTRQSLHSY